MSTVSIADAKNRLSELVKRAEAGEQIIVTRRGRPAARLVPADAAGAASQAARVARTFGKLARLRVGRMLDGDIKAIAREGLD